MKLNCDMGESFGAWSMGFDEAVMPLIDSANVACGFHAGDATVLRKTIALAKKHKVEIGAHVSYPDLAGFGRRSMNVRGQELVDLLHYQIAALDGMCKLQGRKLAYVKPHGALYNDMMRDTELLADVMGAVASWRKPLDLVVLATPKDQKIVQLGFDYGLTLRFEAFADRGYSNSGQLIPRGSPGALLSLDDAVQRAKTVAQGHIVSQKGKKLSLVPDTLCVHGDTPEAVAMVAAIRKYLQSRES